MTYRETTELDLNGIRNLVENSIYPAFDHPDLTPDQQSENNWVIEVSEKSCASALRDEQKKIIVAVEENELAGFIIADKTPTDFPEIDWLIVSHKFQGKGVAKKLMELAMDWIGKDNTIKLGVIHFNQRAIRFYKKMGFADTGKTTGTHKIPRKLMMRKASL